MKKTRRKRRIPGWRNTFRILFCSGLLGITAFVVWIYSLSGEIYNYQDTVDGAHLPDLDAIVCLAGGRGRIATAGDVWFRYWEMAQATEPVPAKVPVLYFSGLGRQVTWPQLSKQLRRGILPFIRPDGVVIENESSNTDTNAQWLARYARDKGWKKILLLTSSYHMKRSRYLFEKVLKAQGVHVEVETLSVYQEPFTADEWRSDLNGFRVTAFEYLKWIYYKSLWGTVSKKTE